MGPQISVYEKQMEDYRWKFKDPDITYNFSFSEKKVIIIDDEDSAENALGLLKEQDTLYVNCIADSYRTDSAKLDLVQIAISNKCCLIFTCRCKKEIEVLKEVLESHTIKKVFHDCSGNITALEAVGSYGKSGIIVHNVEDTQIAQLYVRVCRDIELIVDDLTKLSLPDLYTYCFGGDCPHASIRLLENAGQKFSKNLDETTEKYAALNVLLLPEIFEYLMKNIYPKWNLAPYKAKVEEIKYSKTHQP